MDYDYWLNGLTSEALREGRQFLAQQIPGGSREAFHEYLTKLARFHSQDRPPDPVRVARDNEELIHLLHSEVRPRWR